MLRRGFEAPAELQALPQWTVFLRDKTILASQGPAGLRDTSAEAHASTVGSGAESGKRRLVPHPAHVSTDPAGHGSGRPAATSKRHSVTPRGPRVAAHRWSSWSGRAKSGSCSAGSGRTRYSALQRRRCRRTQVAGERCGPPAKRQHFKAGRTLGQHHHAAVVQGAVREGEPHGHERGLPAAPGCRRRLRRPALRERIVPGEASRQ